MIRVKPSYHRDGIGKVCGPQFRLLFALDQWDTGTGKDEVLHVETFDLDVTGGRGIESLGENPRVPLGHRNARKMVHKFRSGQ